MSGTVLDKATALKHSVGGSTINKIVCKASSHDLAGPKKKHIDFLITLTNNPQVSMPQLVEMIGERYNNTSWIVVMKALITSHNLMSLGNEKYLQCLATRTNPFDLEAFSDRSSILASEMTRYVHKYSRYLGGVSNGYRSTIVDIYRVPRGEQSPFKTMEQGKLIKAAANLQAQIDLLLDIDISQGELTNGVINTAFLMLYKDLIKLYAVYNDALINVLEFFFEMKKAQCKEAIEVYRKFLTRQEGIQTFLKLAEDIGVDKKSHLNLRQVPADLLTALEQHLGEMDAIRKSANNQRPSPQIKAASEKLSELKDQSSSSGSTTPTVPSSTPLSMPSGDSEALQAQKQRFEELKKRASEKNLGIETTSSLETSPTPTGLTGRTSPEGVEFDKIAASRSTPQPKPKTSLLDDLEGLDTQWGSNNPWGSSSFGAEGGGATTTSFNPFQPNPNPSNPWGSSTTGYQEVNLFPQKSGPDFDSVFGIHSTSTTSGNSSNGFGDILQPISSGPLATVTQPQSKPLTTDVDSSLAHAAANLSLELTSGNNKPGITNSMIKQKPTHQWSVPTTQQTTLTGGPNYQRPPMLQSTTLPPTGATGGQPADWNRGMFGNHFPQPMAPQPQMYNMQPMMGVGFQQPWPQPQTMGGPSGFTQGPFYGTTQQPPSFF